MHRGWRRQDGAWQEVSVLAQAEQPWVFYVMVAHAKCSLRKERVLLMSGWEVNLHEQAHCSTWERTGTETNSHQGEPVSGSLSLLQVISQPPGWCQQNSWVRGL